MVELTIDGIKTKVPEGTTVLEAAQYMGIVIPTLCYHPGLSPYGACRICIVEVIKGNRSSLEASCTLPAANGQVIITGSEKVKKARRLIIELLLASCPNSKTLQDPLHRLLPLRVALRSKFRQLQQCLPRVSVSLRQRIA